MLCWVTIVGMRGWTSLVTTMFAMLVGVSAGDHDRRAFAGQVATEPAAGEQRPVTCRSTTRGTVWNGVTKRSARPYEDDVDVDVVFEQSVRHLEEHAFGATADQLGKQQCDADDGTRQSPDLTRTPRQLSTSLRITIGSRSTAAR